MFDSVMYRIQERMRRIREFFRRLRNGGSISSVNFVLNSFLRAASSIGSIRFSTTSSSNSSLAFSKMDAPSTRSLSFSEMESQQDSSMLII